MRRVLLVAALCSVAVPAAAQDYMAQARAIQALNISRVLFMRSPQERCVMQRMTDPDVLDVCNVEPNSAIAPGAMAFMVANTQMGSVVWVNRYCVPQAIGIRCEWQGNVLEAR